MKRAVSMLTIKISLMLVFFGLINPVLSQKISDFHVHINTDLTGRASDIEGNIAVGQHINLHNSNIGYGEEGIETAIVSGGTISYSGGAVAEGKIFLKGSVENIRDVDIHNTVVAENVDILPVDFLAEKKRVQSFSKQYALATANGQVVRKLWKMTFKGDCQSNTQTFLVNARDLAKVWNISTECIPDTAAIIINIKGKKPHFAFKNLNAFRDIAERVVFNFYEAHYLAMYAVVWPGSILAPHAKIKISFSALDGQLVADAWEHKYVIAKATHFTGSSSGNINQPPVISSEASNTAQATIAYHYTIEATDPDDDALNYTLVSAPEGMMINANTLTWIPTSAQVGEQTYQVNVSDGQHDVTQSILLDVSPAPNTPPLVSSEPPLQAQENERYQYAIEATDTDIPAQVLTYSIVSAPDGMQINENTLHWKPSFDQSGEYTVSIAVSDGEVVTEQTYILTVANTNRLPTITSTPKLVVAENTAFLYDINTADPDGDHVALSLKTAPNGMLLNSDNQLIWLPDFNASGTYSITLEASDGDDAVQQTFSLLVVNTNVPPVFTSEPIIQAQENAPYAYSLTATDQDAQALAYEVVVVPSGMILNANTLMWTPTYNQSGAHHVAVTVSDGESTVTQNFTIAVANNNRKPIITSTSPVEVREQHTYSYTLLAEDKDEDTLTYSLSQAPTSMSISDNRITWSPMIGDRGEHTFTIAVSDGEATASQTIKLTVTPGDSDGDGVIDPEDAFPEDATETEDSDADGIGNNADPDDDNDQWTDTDEAACQTDPLDSTSVPTDNDTDQSCDYVDLDDDNDGVDDMLDAFPLDAAETEDTDADGLGNNADLDDDNDQWTDTDEKTCQTNPLDATSIPTDTDNDKQCNPVDADDDNDSWLDTDETACNTDPLNGTSIPADNDGDHSCDQVDPDDDNDNVADNLDAFPFDAAESLDTDADGIGNNADIDDDNDGINDDIDAFPFDAAESTDTDADGIGNNADTDDDNDQWSDSDETSCKTNPLDNQSIPADNDDDHYCDRLDTDDDNDTWLDEDEILCGSNPLDASAIPLDTDADRLCDTIDLDDDGDGVIDSEDAFPLDAKEAIDTDQDGVGNNQDNDDDNDGFNDEAEIAANTDPLDPDDYPDIEPPVIKIVSDITTTADSLIPLKGTATDNKNSVAVTLTNARLNGVVLTADVQDTQWSAAVPLELGDNDITAFAADAAGNQSQTTITIHREDKRIHSDLIIKTPISGQIVNQPSLSLEGTVSSEQAANTIDVTVNGKKATLTPTADVRVHTFSLNNIHLKEGQNILKIVARMDYERYADETLSQTRVITYQPLVEAIDPPMVSIMNPAPDSYINNRSFYVTLNYQSFAENAAITLNGNPVALLSPQAGTVSELLNFPEGQTAWTVNLVITDQSNQSTQTTATYYYDDQPPRIQLENGLQVSPVENPVSQQPLPITGLVTDKQLAQFTINDQPVELEPTATPDTYRFTTYVNLDASDFTYMTLKAQDYSGNQTRLDYTLKFDSQLTLAMLLPPKQTRLLNDGSPFHLQVAARLNGTLANLSAEASIQHKGQSIITQSLTLGEGLVSGYIDTPLSAGQYQLVITLKQGQHLITQTQQDFTVEDRINVPLAMNKVEPANGEQYIETNNPISLYFNQPISVDKLQVIVKETAHGFSYINEDPLGTDGFAAKGYQLKRVDIDDQVINGGLSVLPGAQVISFYPDREFAYASQIQIEVTYDGEAMAHSRFYTRALPTFVEGVIYDQFGQSIPGLEIAIPALKRFATTDANGTYTFGYGDKPQDSLPDGRYQMDINPRLKDTRFGSVMKNMFINQGEKTTISPITVPALNKEDSFSQLASGAITRLGKGDLVLDLTQGQVFFTDGKTQGFSMALFMPAGTFSHHFDPLFMPYWLFNIQPSGIEVEGDLGIDFKLPIHSEHQSQLWLEDTPLLLVGLNPDTDRIEPMGVGIVQGDRVKSLRNDYKRLDYIGYAPMPGNTFEALLAYSSGDIALETLVAQLRKMLTTDNNVAAGNN